MQNQDENKNPVGRPTKYTEDLPEKILDFFDVPLERSIPRDIVTKEGVITIMEIKPNRVPTIERFAANLRVHKSTLYEWSKKYPEFSDALNICRMIQHDMIHQHTFSGDFNAAYSKFYMINNSDMKEKIETVNENKNIEINIDSDDSKL